MLNKFKYLECSEIESKIYIENKLDKKTDECIALQNQLQIERNCYNKENQKLEKEIKNVMEKSDNLIKQY